MTNKYRIVRDGFLGYEVQIKRWWLPLWFQCHGPGQITNTHRTIEAAREFIELHRGGFVVEAIK